MLFPKFVSLGIVVRFRTVVAEHITLRPYGQQLLKFVSAPGTEKAWNTRCRRIWVVNLPFAALSKHHAVSHDCR